MRQVIKIFNTYIDSLIEFTWLEYVTFVIPRMELHQQDLIDLALMVSSRINAITEFEFKGEEIEVLIRKTGGVKYDCIGCNRVN